MKRLLSLILACFFMTSAVFAAININTASESELETLNSIGPTRAKAIVDYRKQHGAFRSTEELKNVPGIKENVYLKIKDDIAISGVNIPPKKEGALDRAGKAMHKAATKTKEKTSGAVKSSAESIEKKARAVKKKAAAREEEAAKEQQ